VEFVGEIIEAMKIREKKAHITLISSAKNGSYHATASLWSRGRTHALASERYSCERAQSYRCLPQSLTRSWT
jgi:hypothetical protein